MLSLGDRITMISSVLSAILTCFLSYLQMSSWVKKKIDCIHRKFLWKGSQRKGRGFCLVNWKRVCKRKKFSGLSIINLRTSILPCFSSGGGRSYRNQEGYGLLLFRIVIGSLLAVGGIGAGTGLVHPLSGRGIIV